MQNSEALGKPGIEARWTHSNKTGMGTAMSATSHLWFTMWDGIVTEVYYPTVDRPQVRDLQYLVTDGKTFFHGGEARPHNDNGEALRPRAWHTSQDTDSSRNALEIDYVDLPTSEAKSGTQFCVTFYWPGAARWEGMDYAVIVR